MNLVDVTIVVPVMDDEDGLFFTINSLNVAAQFADDLVIEVIVVDGNGKSSKKLNDSSQRWSALKIFQVDDPGRGPYAAVDAGLRSGRGRIQSWLNAGDFLFPQAFTLVQKMFARPGVKWICGWSCLMSDEGLIGRINSSPVYYPQAFIARGWYKKDMFGFLQQEGMFWLSELYDVSGGLNLNLKLAADFELWMRFARLSALTCVATPLAAFEVSPGSQRSRVYEQDYLREVAAATPFSLLGLVFQALDRLHYGLVVLARFLAFALGTIVIVDTETGRLVSCKGIWPAARVSCWQLIASLRVSRRGSYVS